MRDFLRNYSANLFEILHEDFLHIWGGFKVESCLIEWIGKDFISEKVFFPFLSFCPYIKCHHFLCLCVPYVITFHVCVSQMSSLFVSVCPNSYRFLHLCVPNVYHFSCLCVPHVIAFCVCVSPNVIDLHVCVSHISL